MLGTIGITTVSLVINGEGELWLMRRTPACRDEHDRWDTCAGRLEEGWKAEDNMRRELIEELGLGIIKRVNVQFIGYRDVFRNGLAHTVGLDFLVRVRRDEPVICEPHKFSEGGWFKKDQLPSPLHSAIPHWLELYGHLI